MKTKDKSIRTSPVIIIGLIFFIILFSLNIVQNFLEAKERKKILNSINCLYFANIVAIDNTSNQRLDANLLCDYEKYSRYTKGAEAAKIVSLEKGEFIFAMTARYFEQGIEIEVVCDGYDSKKIFVIAQDGGVSSGIDKEKITITCPMSRR